MRQEVCGRTSVPGANEAKHSSFVEGGIEVVDDSVDNFSRFSQKLIKSPRRHAAWSEPLRLCVFA